MASKESTSVFEASKGVLFQNCNLSSLVLRSNNSRVHFFNKKKQANRVM